MADIVQSGIGGGTDRTELVLAGLSVGAAESAPSSLQVKKLTFQKPATTTGVQTITGVGFLGAALLIWSDRQAAAGVTDGAQMSIGMTDGTTQVTRFIHHPDNEAATTSAQSERGDVLVYLTNATSGATPTVQAVGVFGAFTADGFTINWTTNDATQTLFHVLVIGGIQAHLEAVKITVNAPGTIAVTGVGFQPQAFVVLGGASDEFGTGDYNLGAPYGSVHGFGFSNATDDICAWTLGRGTGGASDTERGLHADRVATVRTANNPGATDLCSIQITAAGSDGFTITRTVGTTTHQPVQYVLCLRGARFTQGSFNTQASAGNATFTVPTRPKAILLEAHGATTAEADGMGLAIGAWQEGTEGGTWIGGTDNANPSVYARATYTDAALKLYTEAATGASSTLVAHATVDFVSASEVTLAFSTVPASPVPVLYLAIGDVATSTGGTVPEGTNPDPGTFPTSIPLLFVTIETVDGVIRAYAETTLADAAGYYNDAGVKQPRLLRPSNIRRELSDETGAYRFSSWSVELADHDRTFRALQAAGALVGAKVDLWLIDDAVRRAEGDAYRVASGVISSHRALSGFRYELSVEDTFGNLMAETLTEKMTPRIATIDADSIPGLHFPYDNTVVPTCYGLLSDDAEETPQGVVPATYIGPIDVANIGGLSGLVDTYIVAGHAVKNVLGVFYNNPDTPSVRLRVPDSAFGSILWCPHKTGWIAKTGQSGQYADYNGLRYTVIFLAQDIPYTATFTNEDGTTETREINIAEYARNGSVSITVNLEGIEDAGDGTGEVIDDVDRIWQHFLCNYVFNTAEQSGIGGWATVPAYGDYSLIDTDTVIAAKAVADARVTGGYKAAILIGKDNRQQSVAEVLQDLCLSGDMEMGTNRHGQLILSREDTAAAATVTYDAAADILDDGLSTDIQRDTFATTIRYRFARRYAAATAPVPSTPTGWASPARLTAPYQEWISGTVTMTDATATTNVQREHVTDVDLYAIRDALVATDVITRKLARARGPGTPRDGSRVVDMTTGLQGFQQGAVDVELGTYTAITHPEGLASTGWTAQKARVLAIEFDASRFAVTHHARALIT